MSFQPAVFGPVFEPLLDVDRLRDLDAGTPSQADFDRLQSLTVEGAFAHAEVDDPDAARCCLSALWLLYDFLNESHLLSQNVTTAEGSFWHGIMHRREGDFSNAKYWFRKVGTHPVYSRLAADELVAADEWDPYAFVDACQAALRTGGPAGDHCRQLQRREWELLFEHCYHQAIGV